MAVSQTTLSLYIQDDNGNTLPDSDVDIYEAGTSNLVTTEQTDSEGYLEVSLDAGAYELIAAGGGDESSKFFIRLAPMTEVNDTPALDATVYADGSVRFEEI